MAFIGGFDASKIPPSDGFTPIPAGKYLAIMVESNFKKTKSGTGEYLECVFKVAEGANKGRTVKARLNLKNPNEQTVQIAAGELSSICRAVGVLKPNDSHDLHNVPIEITVGVTNADEKGRVYNEISGYSKRGSGAAATAPVEAPAASAEAGPRPSWMGAQ